MESEAISIDKYLDSDVEQRFDFLYENYSVLKAIIKDYREDIIRKNPTDGVMAEISKKTDKTSGIRHALTREQQRAFMDYMAKHPVYYHWWPIFTVLLGTGCRIGECLGLRWEDLDFEKRLISVNHSIVYRYSTQQKNTTVNVSLPKTEAGIREIPMLPVVKDAFDMEKEDQAVSGGNTQVIDGMSGFIFCNRFHKVHNPQTVNDTIRRICKNYNAEESLNAKKEIREAISLPDFSCHHLRHTFATRLCETETNLKVIQDCPGNRSIKSTSNNENATKFAWQANSPIDILGVNMPKYACVMPANGNTKGV